MSPPKIPPEILLVIADNIRDEDGALRYGDFNSFLQVNTTIYHYHNRTLWEEASKDEDLIGCILTHLVAEDNLTRLKFFLELGVDVEFRIPRVKPFMEDDPTLLIIAAHRDNVPLARLLLEHGAKVQYVDQDGKGKFSPLHAARSAEMVDLLLDHGADTNLVDKSNHSPLCWYAVWGEIATMRAILQRGAEVNGFRQGPLHQAVKHDLEAVKLLVEHGADVKERDRVVRSTPLHIATVVGNIEVVKFLVERCPEVVRKRNCAWERPLHVAAGKGRTDVVKFLVERWPAAMGRRDLRLRTPLHVAAVAGKTEVVKFLVQRWPESMRKRDINLNTPLHLATVQGGRAEMVEFLVAGWPEAVREKNRWGDTPLSGTPYMEMARLLVERRSEGKEILHSNEKISLESSRKPAALGGPVCPSELRKVWLARGSLEIVGEENTERG
jgi:ankyrin repeat protein